MSDQHALYIDGQWINTEASVANISPSDSHDVIGHYAQASIEHVDQAIEAANRAVADWGVSGLETRYQALMAIGNELIERSAELGEYSPVKKARQKPKVLARSIDQGSFSIILPPRYTAKSTTVRNRCGPASKSRPGANPWALL